MRAPEEVASILFNAILGRDPRPNELVTCVSKLARADDIVDVVQWIGTSPEARNRLSALAFPIGHFYSPIVDVSLLRDKILPRRPAPPPSLPGLNIDIEEMALFWNDRLSSYARTTPFHAERGETARYAYNNPAYSYGDAITLRAMIAHFRPQNMIEVGSGWSSGCALDTIDEFKLETNLTFIEPHPELLKSRMYLYQNMSGSEKTTFFLLTRPMFSRRAVMWFGS